MAAYIDEIFCERMPVERERRSEPVLQPPVHPGYAEEARTGRGRAPSPHLSAYVIRAMAPPIYCIMITSSNSGSVVLSIVIVNWHSATFLEQCLHTIYRETKDLSFEVIVIDNATFDGSAEIVRRSFSEARFIQSKDNLGFSKGNNVAYKDS